MQAKSATHGHKENSQSQQRANQLNHVMNWQEGKIKGRENHTFRNGVREAIYIRQGGSAVMNQDQGQY